MKFDKASPAYDALRTARETLVANRQWYPFPHRQEVVLRGCGINKCPTFDIIHPLLVVNAHNKEILLKQSFIFSNYKIK